jgi:hypothetical protein
LFCSEFEARITAVAVEEKPQQTETIESLFNLERLNQLNKEQTEELLNKWFQILEKNPQLLMDKSSS